MDCNFRSSPVTPQGPAPRLPAPRRPSSLQFTGLRRPRSPRRLLVNRACGSGDVDPVSGFSGRPSKVFVEEVIGAEYGEGFETFRMDGPLKVDVDYLNEKLQECFLQRIRHAMKPDEAFGLIFSWDNVVADTRSVKWDAWRQLAYEEGKDIPSDGHIQRVILHASVDQVLQKILSWEKGESELGRLKSRLLELYYENLLKLEKPKEGLGEWLESLSTAGIPCAVISSLDRRNMLETLQRMGLDKYFQAIVTEEDGMESIAHRFLSAAVKLDRKPSKCVVFEDDPRGITAAHNCTMMAVALIGSHPAYELVQADLAIASFNELSVINLRRLFAHKGSEFMDLQKQVIEKSPPKRKLMIDTIWSIRFQYYNLRPPSCGTSSLCAASRWTFPPRGVVKLNVDAAGRPSGSGYAGILRDVDGRFIEAFTGHIQSPDPMFAECFVILMALSLLSSRTYTAVIIESDALEAVTYISSATQIWPWRLCGLLTDIHFLFNGDTSTGISIISTHRTANQVVHFLASSASIGPPFQLLSVPPEGLQPIMDNDILY